MPTTKPAPDRSPTIMNEIVLPSHTNALGTIFGGVVMGWVDIAAAIAAQRYARSNVVTASIDYLNFINPIKTGWTVRVCAQVSYVGKTSMEVEVIVDAEKNQTGERKRATHAYLTFVAVDENGRPTKVTPYVPQTAEEKKAYEAAKIRRERRLQWR